MRKLISVAAERDYSIKVDVDWLMELSLILPNYGKVLVISSREVSTILNIESHLSKFPNVHFYSTPDGESQKSIATAEAIWNYLGENQFSRSDLIVAIGGGATTDLGGFVAATWLRGISWIAIPTTLAGMVDAAIGGKTGLNSPSGKNLIGAFNSPAEVLVDLKFLLSLSDRDFQAGLAEVIKTGFISDVEILKILESADNLTGARAVAGELISRSAKVKADVVSVDFKESKLREILNYGHTLGHAIEKHGNFSMRHGEAVAIGLVFAAELSAIAASLSPEEVNRHRVLLEKYGLPTRYERDAWPDLLNLMRGDKKSRGSRIRFIGLAKAGEPIWLEEISENQLIAAYERIS